MSQFKLACLDKLKTDMLSFAPHISLHRGHVHSDELSRLHEFLNLVNTHIY